MRFCLMLLGKGEFAGKRFLENRDGGSHDPKSDFEGCR